MFCIPLRALLTIAALTPASVWPVDPADPAAAVPPLEFRSAIGSYRTHATEPVGSWRGANERVGSQAGAHAHASPGDAPTDDPHATHGAPADTPAVHDHGDSPAAMADAGDKPQACKHGENHHCGGGMKPGHDCPHMKNGDGHDGH